eukprot:835313-Rhodomonas_salina.3
MPRGMAGRSQTGKCSGFHALRSSCAVLSSSFFFGPVVEEDRDGSDSALLSCPAASSSSASQLSPEPEGSPSSCKISFRAALACPSPSASSPSSSAAAASRSSATSPAASHLSLPPSSEHRPTTTFAHSTLTVSAFAFAITRPSTSRCPLPAS